MADQCADLSQGRNDNVYRGIDLVYYGSSRQLEYDFIVAPGAGPDAITLGFEGADRLEVDSEGDLVLSTASGLILFKRPVVYQEQAVGRVSIASDYVWKGSDRIGFRAAVYDTALPLIIDPVLSYSTYLGGSGEETAMDIAVDGSGAAYITGFTNSPDFPTRSPLQTMPAGPSDAFVMKLAPDGPSLVYSTYLGGELNDDGRAAVRLNAPTKPDGHPVASELVVKVDRHQGQELVDDAG